MTKPLDTQAFTWRDIILDSAHIDEDATTVTVTERAGELIERLGGPAKQNQNIAYLDSYDTPRWAVWLVLSVFYNFTPIQKEPILARAFARAARDPQWVEAFIAVYTLGNRVAANRFAMDA